MYNITEYLSYLTELSTSFSTHLGLSSLELPSLELPSLSYDNLNTYLPYSPFLLFMGIFLNMFFNPGFHTMKQLLLDYSLIISKTNMEIKDQKKHLNL